MGEAYNQLINDLLAQVRDPQGSYHPVSLVAELLGRIQWALNDAFQLQLIDTTLSTNAYQCFYGFSLLPDTISILSVRENDRDLDKVDTLHDLAMIDRSWHRSVGPRYECFCQLGETYLVLYPTLTQAGTVHVISTRLTPLTASIQQDSTIISQENNNLLLTLTRALLHLRQRKYESLASDLNLLTYYLAARKLPYARPEQPTNA